MGRIKNFFRRFADPSRREKQEAKTRDFSEFGLQEATVGEKAKLLQAIRLAKKNAATIVDFAERVLKKAKTEN